MSTTPLGREDTLAELQRRFDDGARLITLVGTGGVGKTTLAAAFAGGWPEETFAVALDEARAPADIISAVASRLDMAEGGWRDTSAALDRVGGALAQRGACLLVVNTLEAALTPASEVLEALLNSAPEARFLCTSRQALGRGWEQALPLPPLSPEAAARLFNQEATRHLPSFDGERWRASIDALVLEVDCVPLAVLLAASLAGLFDPTRLLERLRQTPSMLANLDDPSRGGSIERSVAWSWSLLSEAEQRVLVGCAVFASPFTADAAAAVLADDDEVLVLGNLERLRRKSLLRTETDPYGAPRLVPYAAVRAFVAGRAADARPSGLRHARWCLDEAARMATSPEHTDTVTGRRLLTPELIAALRSPAADPVMRARLTLAMRPMYGNQRPMDEGHAALNAALSPDVSAGLPPDLIAELCYARAGLIRHLGHVDEALIDIERALTHPPIADKAALLKVRLLFNSNRLDEGLKVVEATLAALEAREERSALLEGEAHNLLGNLRHSRGENDEAKRLYRRGQVLFEKAERPGRAAGCLVGLGNLLSTEGHTREARAHYLRALEDLQAPTTRAAVLNNLGVTAVSHGPAKQARAWLEEALAIYRRQGDRRQIARLRSIIASTKVLSCTDRFALDLELNEVAELLDRYQQPLYVATARWSLGLLHHNAGDEARARDHYLAAEAAYAALSYPLGTGIARSQLGALAALAERFDDAEALWRAADADLAASGWPHAEAFMDVSRGWRMLISGNTADTRTLIDTWSANNVAVEVRTIAAVLGAELTRRSNRGGGDLRVSESADCFTLPDGQRIDMGRRGAARRLLSHLARARLSQPGTVVGRDTLIAAGWPGEQIFPDAALARLYTTIRTLRRLGLDELLVTREGGYLLTPDVPLVLDLPR